MNNRVTIAIGLVLAGILYTGYELYEFMNETMPKMEEERSAREGQLSTKQAELKRLQNFSQNIELIKQDLRELNIQLESALEHMPRQFNLSALLRKITMLAQNSGIEMSAFRPEKKEVKAANSFYSAIAISMDITGNFTQTLVFLDQLTRLKRIVNVESLALKLPDSELASKKTGPVVATSHLKIQTYRFAE